MTMWTEYLFPETVEEALEMLGTHAGRARLIAGGTDLVLQAQQGKCTSTVMVDVTRIPGLDFIEERDGHIWIGPQATHAQVAASPLVREHAGLLAVGCGSVGGPQIRHVATLVGNVVNAMPAADGAVALFALDAEVEVVEGGGRRIVPIAEMYAGVGVCTLNPCAQMVTGIRFRPLPAGWGWSFKRLAQRRALILPMLNTAVVVQVADGRFVEARIAVGPVAATPMRACDAEAALRGRPVNTEAIAEAARLAMEAAHPRDSAVRGSGEYRRAMVEVLVRRGLEEAVGRAGGAIHE
jgi:CO/xanthine dehydrogenase FAD-binding subunit